MARQCREYINLPFDTPGPDGQAVTFTVEIGHQDCAAHAGTWAETPCVTAGALGKCVEEHIIKYFFDASRVESARQTCVDVLHGQWIVL